MMKDKLLDLIRSFEGFKHTEELITAINGYSALMAKKQDKAMVLNGFYVLLCELKNNTTLQRGSLLSTMLAVRNHYGRHTDDLIKHSSISFAINHVQWLIKKQTMKREAEEKYEQQMNQEGERMALATKQKQEEKKRLKQEKKERAIQLKTFKELGLYLIE